MKDRSLAFSISSRKLDILDRYRDLLSAAEMTQLTQDMRRPPTPAIRVNTLKIDLNQARRTWPEWYAWQIRPVPFCSEGWQITKHSQSLARTLEHRMGFYYIQDAASMLPVEMFDFDSQDRPLILDMAASPGGKTTHLLSKLNDKGLIIANDHKKSRIVALLGNLQGWGAMGTAITNYPGQRFGSWFPEVFDKVLLDAPCSGENLRTFERRRSRPVSARDRQLLQRQQIRLLTGAFQALKPGGQLVYATCSLAPEENEAVLDALLKLYPRQAAIETVDHLGISAPGLTSFNDIEFQAEMYRAVRLWPHMYDTSGFFAALIGKRDSVSVKVYAPPACSLAETGLKIISKKEQAGVVSYLLQTYGFDLGALIEQQSLVLARRKQSTYAIPEQFLANFANLPCATRGMLIGTQKEHFVPSHELIARFGSFDSQFTGRRLMLSDEQADIWLDGRDLLEFGDLPYPTGAIILLEDSKRRFLGRGKILSGRVRNMLPRPLIYGKW